MTELEPTSRGGRGLRLGLVLTAVLALGLVAYGLSARHSAFAALQQRSSNAAVVHVATTRPAPGSSGELLLPGTLEAVNETNLYARVQGFVRKLHADIGQHVTQGQLLAEIDAPELDQQILSAQADRANSRASEELARSTAARYQTLLDQKLVSQQSAEEKFADARVRRAALDSQEANVARLQQLQSFKRVVAPFDGTITARNAEPGLLVSAAGSVVPGAAATTTPLFRLVSKGPLQLRLSVPQAQAWAVRPGATARIHVPEQPGAQYTGRIVRDSGALDAQTRALRVELLVNDPSGKLLPGTYVQAAFDIPAADGTYRLPVSTLIFRGQGAQVAVLTADNHIALRKVTMGRDFGTEYEIVSGVAVDENVVLNPPDSLLDGQAVQPVQAQAQAQPAQPQAQSPAVSGPAQKVKP
jgi:RND family efflux transporter MFP subunit